MQPEIVTEWEPAEASNPNYFYDLEPGEVRRASVWVRPKFPGSGLFSVRIAEPLPGWLRVSPTSFTPPAKLFVEVDATSIDLEEGEERREGFTLEFFLDE